MRARTADKDGGSGQISSRGKLLAILALPACCLTQSVTESADANLLTHSISCAVHEVSANLLTQSVTESTVIRVRMHELLMTLIRHSISLSLDEHPAAMPHSMNPYG